ncbi:hypothetical protein CHL79_07000 [Delftia acidovorans]|uniref:hypothetical protein n=1 Tax=Delftia acidovorans TaxID=80866 RepID=UPI000BC2D5BD|nr:hypothetical protein [Delftia acidovorans]ATH12190.1 hypothetical protein CHL79_07000 [Delftia acidovorans]
MLRFMTMLQRLLARARMAFLLSQLDGLINAGTMCRAHVPRPCAAPMDPLDLHALVPGHPSLRP